MDIYATPFTGQVIIINIRYIIDEIKLRLPVWKKEHYVNGDSGWVNCERCAASSSRKATSLRA